MGDELNMISVKERSMVPHFLSICPWEIMYSKKSPEMSDTVFIPKPNQITVNHWLSEVANEHHLTIRPY
jgi:hypothetical protein